MLGLLGLLACGGPTLTELEDVGLFCRDTTDGELVVDFGVCLSSSCDTLLEATCSGELVGDELVVTATVRYETDGDECTDDCGRARAECRLPTLTDTEGLTVRYGTQVVPFRNGIPTCDL
ncbi:MAG: hypothetical protein KC656_14890 [Myxococcales bacterium]|nr:hypothetical protein [Myxococcales bacterium]